MLSMSYQFMAPGEMAGTIANVPSEKGYELVGDVVDDNSQLSGNTTICNTHFTNKAFIR